MKIYLIYIVLFNVMLASAFANSNNVERNRFWMTDAYNYGYNGKKCSRIYYNYGTDKWTFNSDDPTLLKQLYEACKVGEEDRVTGENNLPQILDEFHRQK